MTRIKLETGDPTKAKLDLLGAMLFEGDAPDEALDRVSGGQASRVAKSGDWKGKAKSSLLLFGEDGARLLLVGLGPRKGATLERVRRGAASVVSEARRLDLKRVGVMGPSDLKDVSTMDPTSIAGAIAEAIGIADYAFERHKTQAKTAAKPAKGAKAVKAVRAVKAVKAVGVEPKKPRAELTVEVFGPRPAGAVVERTTLVAEATNFARDLANEPGNIMTPTALADAAKLAGRTAGFKVKVIEPDEMKQLGMGSLLCVAQGSSEPARLIQMEWTPRTKAKAGTVVLVGKGLTFDSGGISIKPADKMWEMKFDKCGGCAVIGLMVAIARTKLPLHVVGLVPATENMPGGSAVKPGDVVRAMNGKTIEVLNTDAEGRLILADALCYAARFEPEVVIDMATLTGAVVVALGDVRAAIMGNDDVLSDALRKAGDATGELIWPLPMDDAYGEHVKGETADVKNLGKGRDAGSIAGGQFLKHFVPEGAAWAHLDIAGTAWGNGDSPRGYVGKGATGFGVRLVYEYLRARAEG